MHKEYRAVRRKYASAELVVEADPNCFWDLVRIVRSTVLSCNVDGKVSGGQTSSGLRTAISLGKVSTQQA